MRKLAAAGAALAVLAACSAQTEPGASGETATQAAPATASAEAAEPAAAENADPAGLAKGTIVEAIKQTQCREVGENADEPPWDVAVGSFAKVIAVQGTEILVDMAASECLIPADAVKPSET
jgi:hypothetical protein